MFCELCNGLLGYLGELGKMDWWRCQNCGADCGVEKEVIPHEEETEE
jgi:hypothetical protein